MNIFISYRRKTGKWQARCLHLLLKSALQGRLDVTLDDQALEGAGNYPRRLRELVDDALAVLLVVEPELRIVQDHKDWVYQELSQAIGRNTTVYPICFDDAELVDLPSNLLPIYRTQTFQVTDEHWKDSLEKVAKFVSNIERTRHFNVVLRRRHRKLLQQIVNCRPESHTFSWPLERGLCKLLKNKLICKAEFRGRKWKPEDLPDRRRIRLIDYYKPTDLGRSIAPGLVVECN